MEPSFLIQKQKQTPDTTTNRLRIFKKIFGRGPQGRQNPQYVAASQLGQANTIDFKLFQNLIISLHPFLAYSLYSMVKLQISFQFHPKIWGNDPTKDAFIVGTQKNQHR